MIFLDNVKLRTKNFTHSDLSCMAMRFSILLFIFLLFAFSRHVATKEFYIVTFLFAININKVWARSDYLFDNRIYMMSLVVIASSLMLSVVFGEVSYDNVKSVMRVMIFLTVFVLLVTKSSELHVVLRIIMSATIFGSAFDLCDYFTYDIVILSEPFGVGKKYLWHIYAGGVYVLVAIIAAYLASIEKGKAKKFIYLSCCTYLIGLVYLTQSRAAIVTCVASIIVFIVLSKKVYAKYCICIFVTTAFFAAFVERYGYSFARLLERKDASRFEIWAKSFDKIYNKLFFGHGLGAKFHMELNSGGVVTEPHNLYLYVLYTGGLVGFAFFMVFLALIAFTIYKLRNQQYKPLLASLFVFVIIFNFFDSRMIVDDIGVGWHLFWLPVGIIMVLSTISNIAMPVTNSENSTCPEVSLL